MEYGFALIVSFLDRESLLWAILLCARISVDVIWGFLRSSARESIFLQFFYSSRSLKDNRVLRNLEGCVVALRERSLDPARVVSQCWALMGRPWIPQA